MFSMFMVKTAVSRRASHHKFNFWMRERARLQNLMMGINLRGLFTRFNSEGTLRI